VIASYKGVYPFRLSVPSFIYPADWCTNVERLGPFVDEIELLFLESHSDSCFPPPEDIRRLSALADELQITYNVHLPSDISLADPNPIKRSKAVEILAGVISLAVELKPSTWTLHLPFGRESASSAAIDEWRNLNREGLSRLLEMSGIAPGALSIETLFYPYAWIGDMVRSLNLSFCFDTGHMMLCGEDLHRFYTDYADVILIMHLHGVDGTRDHVPLDRFTAEREREILSFLPNYKGIVSLEIFSLSYLQASLTWLAAHQLPENT
jgi:sugar phosphate isomerase/epimerase